MKQNLFSPFTYILAAGLILPGQLVDAQGFSGFFKGDSRKVLSAEQLSSQEGSANSLLAKAQQYEQSGKRRQARDTYGRIVKSYPRTDAAAEAQFKVAQIRESEGEGRKAFEEYQELMTTYRNSPNFNTALERQFAIAEALRGDTKKGFLGIGVAIQPSKLIEMYESISKNGPHTDYAPRALLSVGQIRKKLGEKEVAIKAFQSVVDEYATSQYATEAQYEIYQIRGIKAEESNSPNQDRAQMEAGLDFVNQNPEDQRAQEIKSDMQQIEERSIEKLFTTGEYYEKMNKPESARIYYREVVKNPNTPFFARAQERLAAIDSSTTSVSSRTRFMGSKPSKKDKLEMRTSDDEVIPLPSDN